MNQLPLKQTNIEANITVIEPIARNNFWQSHCAETNIRKGQTQHDNIHGLMEATFNHKQDHNERVSGDYSDVDDEQKRSYQAVVFGLESRETHDEKLSYYRSCGFVYL